MNKCRKNIQRLIQQNLLGKEGSSVEDSIN